MSKIGLFLGAEPQGGGAFQYSQAILDGVCSLRENNTSVVVATNSQRWRDYCAAYRARTLFLPKDLWGRNFDRPRFFNPPVRMVRAISPCIHSLAKALVSEHCDLWIFPSQDVWGYQIPVPSLVAIHDLMHRYERRFPEVSANGEYRMREWHYRSICRWAQGILVDSEVGKRHVEESYRYPSERIFVLPFVASTCISSPEPVRDFDVRYNLPEKFIFYPAQFWHHKNHAGLIKAMKKLKSIIPDLKCVFVGSQKNGYQAAVDLIRETGLGKDILVLGYVPPEDMPELYRRARALVMPTYFGPTNIPPLEAFANGCPVAVSRIYGIPKQVGDAALLFDPESVDDMARAILQIWTDDRLCEELKRKGLQKTAEWGQYQFNARFRTVIESVLSMPNLQ